MLSEVAGWVRRTFWPRESFLQTSNGATSAGKPVVLNRDGLIDQSMLTGTDLAEYVADTIGAMVTGNTETGIAVTYQDADNTLDFDAQTAGDGRYLLLTGGTISGSLAVSGGVHFFHYDAASPGATLNCLQVAFTRAAGTNNFRGSVALVAMVGRKGTTYYRGAQLVIVNGTNNVAMPHTESDLMAGLTTTVTTNTATNLTLKFDLGDTEYTELRADVLLIGTKHSNLTVTASIVT